MPTLQETFDRVAKHLLTQNQKCADPEDSTRCLYRGPNGLQCAAGCLIPEEMYREELENAPVDSKDYRGEQFSPVGVILESLGYDTAFVQRLQDIHDTQCVSSWKDALECLAIEFGLDCHF